MSFPDNTRSPRTESWSRLPTSTVTTAPSLKNNYQPYAKTPDIVERLTKWAIKSKKSGFEIDLHAHTASDRFSEQ